MAKKIQTIPQGKYYLHNRQDSQGRRQIYVRYYCRGKQIRRRTGIYVLEKDWDGTRQQIKPSDTNARHANRFLRENLNRIETQLLCCEKEITPAVIENILNGISGEKTKDKTLVRYCHEYNDMRYRAGYCTYRTYENKASCINVFAKYLKSKGQENLAIDDIDIALIDDYISYRFETLGNKSPEGVNKTLVPIYKALEYASDNGLVERAKILPLTKRFVPVKKKRYADRDADEIKYLKANDINKLIDCYSHCGRSRTKDFLEIWFFSYYACGLRISDILTLEWRHIDFNEKILCKSQYKTGENITIPLNDNALDILAKWQKSPMSKHNRYVFRLMEDDFDIHDERKLLMRKNSVTKTINTSLKVVGTRLSIPFHLTMHVARHSFAVAAINNGMDIKILSKLMGHTTVMTTEKVYAKVLSKTISREYLKKTSFYNKTKKMQIE